MTSPTYDIADPIEQQVIVARLKQAGYDYLAEKARDLLNVSASAAECIDFVDQLSRFIGEDSPPISTITHTPAPVHTHIIDVSCGPDGSAYIVLPDDLVAHLGCDEGDQVVWIDNHDGSFTLKKHTDYEFSHMLADPNPF